MIEIVVKIGSFEFGCRGYADCAGSEFNASSNHERWLGICDAFLQRVPFFLGVADMWNEQDVELLFHSYYILWLVGMMEPELTAELDEMSPPGTENWRQVMRRKCRVDPRRVRAHFLSLCESMSDDEAVEAILLEFASGNQVPSRHDRASHRG